MVECTVCDTAVAVSDACPHCGQPVCDAHRARAAHDCAGVESDSQQWYTDPDAGRTGGTGGDELSNPRRLAAGVAVVVVLVLCLAAVLAATTGPIGFDEQRAERLIVAEVNEARLAHGVDPLPENGSLTAVARYHSEDMAAKGYVSHVAPNGSRVGDRFERFDIGCYGRENIYYTDKGRLLIAESAYAERVVQGWLDSPAHRATMLAPEHSRQGIGIATGNGGIYVTQTVC